MGDASGRKEEQGKQGPRDQGMQGKQGQRDQSTQGQGKQSQSKQTR
jgi:hypothetical protein